MQWYRAPGVTLSALTVTPGGRSLYAVTMGCGPRKILAAAGYHANEWLTSLALWGAMERLWTEHPTVLEQGTLLAVPCVNPDGAALVMGLAAGQEAACTEAPEDWRANLRGVDLNLHFPAAWETVCTRKPTSPGHRDYPGQAPLCEPETRALAAWTEEQMPEALLALHSQGRELYADFLGRVPDPVLAEKLSRISGYPLVTTPPEASGGGHKDWFIHRFDRPGFTAELGLGENPLPLSQLPAMTATVTKLLLGLLLP